MNERTKAARAFAEQESACDHVRAKRIFGLVDNARVIGGLLLPDDYRQAMVCAECAVDFAEQLSNRAAPLRALVEKMQVDVAELLALRMQQAAHEKELTELRRQLEEQSVQSEAYRAALNDIARGKGLPHGQKGKMPLLSDRMQRRARQALGETE